MPMFLRKRFSRSHSPSPIATHSKITIFGESEVGKSSFIEAIMYAVARAIRPHSNGKMNITLELPENPILGHKVTKWRKFLPDAGVYDRVHDQVQLAHKLPKIFRWTRSPIDNFEGALTFQHILELYELPSGAYDAILDRQAYYSLSFNEWFRRAFVSAHGFILLLSAEQAQNMPSHGQESRLERYHDSLLQLLISTQLTKPIAIVAHKEDQSHQVDPYQLLQFLLPNREFNLHPNSKYFTASSCGYANGRPNIRPDGHLSFRRQWVPAGVELPIFWLLDALERSTTPENSQYIPYLPSYGVVIT